MKCSFPPAAFAAAVAALLLLPAAQFLYNQYPADTARLYSYVEQMPALPGGGSNAALVRAVQRRLVLPPNVAAGRREGLVLVRLVAGMSGKTPPPPAGAGPPKRAPTSGTCCSSPASATPT